MDIVKISLLFGCLGVISLLLTRWFGIILSVSLLLVGFTFSLLLPHFELDTGIRASNIQNLIFYVFLPALIFEAAFNIHQSTLKKWLPAILSLSMVGVVLSTVLSAIFIYSAIGHPSGFPFIAALLTGVLISATDPVAVVSQLKELGAPNSLAVLMEGESLFNDATAIVLFSLLLSMAVEMSGQGMENHEFSAPMAILQFIKVFFGGITVGGVLSLLGLLILRLLSHAPHQILVTLVCAYGSFYVGEHLFHVSGVMAVLTTGILLKRSLSQNALHETLEAITSFWESIGFIFNIFVFLIMGIVITIPMFTERWLAIVIGIAAVIFARILSVTLSLFISQHIFRTPVDSRFAPVLVWGGLRGAVTIALVLSLPTTLEYWWTIQSICFGVVLFTLLVQAPTNKMLLKKLKIVS